MGITKVSDSKSDLQPHSGSLTILSFDGPYIIFY